VFETCDNGDYVWGIRYLPLYFYVHVHIKDCMEGSVRQEYSFSNFYYCNGCDQIYFWLSNLEPDNNVMIKYDRHRRAQSVPLVTNLDGFDYYGTFECEERNFELNRINTEKYCYLSDYIVSILKDNSLKKDSINKTISWQMESLEMNFIKELNLNSRQRPPTLFSWMLVTPHFGLQFYR
jgi:hypothetical protein